MEFLDKLRPVTLLILRCTLALIFINSGYAKIAHGIAPTERYMTGLGLPAYFAYIAVAVELGGGVLLALGLGTRIVALLMTIQMAIAIWKVDGVNGIRAIQEYQFTLLVCVAALALVSFGAGRLSLDYAFFGGGSRPRPKPRA